MPSGRLRALHPVSSRSFWRLTLGNRLASSSFGLFQGPVLGLLLLLTILSGCATYQSKVANARKDLVDHRPDEAVKLLEPLAHKDGDDQLVYLLDYATALQLDGKYKESAQEFGRAQKIADIKDYHSLSRVASSLLLSEEMVQYKGDDYEKVLINAVNAVNYLELGELDDSLVEVRKLNEMLYKFKYEAKKNYDQNPFAFYLGAVIYEADQKWDDAYISYKSAYDVLPEYLPLHEDLIRSAIKAQRDEDVENWRKKFPEVKIRPEWSNPGYGEIVLVYQQGWGPRKGPRPESPRFPKLFPVYSNTVHAQLVVNDIPRAQSTTIFNVQKVAIKTLDDDYARLVASRVGGVVAKAVVADQIRQHNEVLGILAFLALNASDRADVRQWSTLPETFQIARYYVKAGTYRVKVQGISSAGYEASESKPEANVTVLAGKKAFVTWRSVK